MISHQKVTLRPVDWRDGDQMFEWQHDCEIEILSGWGPWRSRTTYDKKFREFLENPPDDLVVFAVESDGELVGRIELSEIERKHRRAALGLVIGRKERWGQGIGSLAVLMMADYAFSVENLSRLFAFTYDFNIRSRRLFASAGFMHEGILRQHEYHNGMARDLYVFGLQRDDLYKRHETLFPIPQ